MSGTEVLHERTGDPWWAAAVPDLVQVEPPDGYRDAWSFTAPVVDMTVYLSWLRSRLDGAGRDADADQPGRPPADRGRGRQLRGPRLAPAGGRPGRTAGARAGRDRRGSRARPVVARLRRSHLCRPALGHRGRRRHGRGGDWSRTPSQETAAGILRRATGLVPECRRPCRRARVGLRPVRPEVRVEAVDKVVHCYGQGGAGATVSWGRADEVVGLVAELG